MKCLCCGKELNPNSEIEMNTLWHTHCVKKFFKTQTLPVVDLDECVFKKIASENVANGITITGVQKKISLNLSSDINPRLTLVNYPTGYILKPQTNEYKMLPEFEFLAMNMAKLLHIETVPFALIKLKSGEFAYITKRIDREFTKDSIIKIAMEDFCQLGERLTEDKYKGSYEKCAKIISQYSSLVDRDLSEFFLRIIFCYIIGNSDMHLKNFSLIEEKQHYVLSPAYDLLPVQLVIDDNEELALTLRGKKSNFKKEDFIKFAIEIGLTERIALKIIQSVINNKDKLIELIEESYISYELKNNFIKLITNRIENLNKDNL